MFKDILSCVGRKSKDGKRKGEIKVHTVINADEKGPGKVASKLKAQKVKFYDRENKREFEFISNLFE